MRRLAKFVPLMPDLFILFDGVVALFVAAQRRRIRKLVVERVGM